MGAPAIELSSGNFLCCPGDLWWISVESAQHVHVHLHGDVATQYPTFLVNSYSCGNQYGWVMGIFLFHQLLELCGLAANDVQNRRIDNIDEDTEPILLSFWLFCLIPCTVVGQEFYHAGKILRLKPLSALRDRQCLARPQDP